MHTTMDRIDLDSGGVVKAGLLETETQSACTCK